MRVMEDSFDPSFGEAWTTAQLAAMIPMPGVWLSLAKEADRVIGFSLARAVADEAELLLLAVVRECRQQGVGRSLVDHFESLARIRGASRLHLEVRDNNAAVELYHACGFAEAGRRPRYYVGRDGQVYDAITLTKSVSD